MYLSRALPSSLASIPEETAGKLQNSEDSSTVIAETFLARMGKEFCTALWTKAHDLRLYTGENTQNLIIKSIVKARSSTSSRTSLGVLKY